MGVSGFADELRALGFSEEVVGEVLQGLADLYISPRIPYSYVVKYTSGDVVRRTKYWPYSEVVKRILLQYGYADASSKYAVYGPHANWYFIALTEKGLPPG